MNLVLCQQLNKMLINWTKLICINKFPIDFEPNFFLLGKHQSKMSTNNQITFGLWRVSQCNSCAVTLVGRVEILQWENVTPSEGLTPLVSQRPSNWPLLKPHAHHGNMVPRGLRGLIMPWGLSLSYGRWKNLESRWPQIGKSYIYSPRYWRLSA